MDVTEAPDDRDLDEGGLDLTPRTDRPTHRRRRRNRWVGVVALVVLLAGAGFIINQALGTATLFYLNADEAVAQRSDLGQKRFRLQGVVSTQIQNADHGPDEPIRFELQYNQVAVDVHHTGSEPALFKPGLPVVVEGHWDSTGKWFDSTRLLVKHTEEYKAANDKNYEKEHPNRVKGASTSAEEK